MAAGRGCAAIAGALLAAAGLAQERRPLFGMVSGPDGQPVAHATVQLAYVPLGWEAEDAVDHPTATTDARGRFRADVLPGVAYRAWAIGPDEADDRHLATKMQLVWPGQRLELRATERWPKTKLLCPRPESWKDVGPLRVRILPDQIALPRFDLPIADDGSVARVAVPAPPPGSTVEYLDARGNVLGLACRLDALLLARGVSLSEPPRSELPMRVVDAQGEPIAGAEILQRSPFQNLRIAGDTLGLSPPIRQTWRRLGVTDAEGALHAAFAARPLAKPSDLFEFTTWLGLVFQARKAGYATVVASPFTDRVRDDTQPLTEMLFTLLPAAPFRGRVLLGEGKPLAGARVTVRAQVDFDEFWENRQPGWLVWHPTTGADGTFLVEDMPANATTTMLWIGSEAGLPLALHSLPKPPRDEVEVLLSRFRTVHLRLLDADTTPVGDAQVLIKSLADDDPVDAWTMQAVPDSAGRVTVRLQTGPWLVFARNATHMTACRLDGSADQEHELRLAPMATMRGRVVDGAGKPIVGVGLHYDQMTRNAVLDTDELELRRVAMALNPIWIARSNTDAEGGFVCRFLDVPGVSLLARVKTATEHTPPFPLRAGENGITIVVE